MHCPRGSYYTTCGAPCRRTCKNYQQARPCRRKCQPGCQCNPGRVWHRDHCVLPSECPPASWFAAQGGPPRGPPRVPVGGWGSHSRHARSQPWARSQATLHSELFLPTHEWPLGTFDGRASVLPCSVREKKGSFGCAQLLEEQFHRGEKSRHQTNIKTNIVQQEKETSNFGA